MRFVTGFAIIGIVLFTSCTKKKSGLNIPPGDEAQELTATVSVFGGPDSSFKSNGTYTTFHYNLVTGIRYTGSKDTAVSIQGYIPKYGNYSSRTIDIKLLNISVPGTFFFNVGVTRKASCVYTRGDPFFSNIYEIYSTTNSSQPGSITIDSISSTYIKGSFTANCQDTIKIKNGTFKGRF